MKYLTEEEAKMPLDMALMQLTLGLQTCKTKGNVKRLLMDAVELGRREYKQKVRTKMNELVVECISHSTDELINEHIIKRIVQNKMRDLELE